MSLRSKREDGFSTLELVIVVAMVLIVTAMAAPSVFNMIYNIRLRSAAQTVSGMMQTARMQAVRDNKYRYACTGLAEGVTKTWVASSSACSVPASIDAQAQLGTGLKLATAGYPGGINTAAGFGPLSTSYKPAFNERGLPCTVSGGRCLPTVSSVSGPLVATFVIYLTDARPVGANGWAAVTVSPAGRTQVWIWNGSVWNH